MCLYCVSHCLCSVLVGVVGGPSLLCSNGGTGCYQKMFLLIWFDWMLVQFLLLLYFCCYRVPCTMFICCGNTWKLQLKFTLLRLAFSQTDCDLLGHVNLPNSAAALTQ